MKTIELSHGNGGLENNQLIESIFFKAFANEYLKSEDSAVIIDGKFAFTTDSFTVNPIFFSGGNIGKLAICGVCNDLAMMGAKPLFISFSVILEEGFDIALLDKIVQSTKEELAKNGALVVTGDTKVVPKGAVDKIFINCSGVGEIQYSGISSTSLNEGDIVLVSRDIGCHGAAIFANREGINIESNLQSDCASLWPIISELLNAGTEIISLRDATRGGIAAVLNEWAKASDVCIEVDEQKIPISNEVAGICELLGFEAYNLANEGTFVLAIKSSELDKVKTVLSQFENTQNFSIIGRVSHRYKGKVVLNNLYNTSRFMDMPSGELLPRIC